MTSTYTSPDILISVLRSTSFLLEHYGYAGHDPSLSELQRSLGRAMVQLEAQAPAEMQRAMPSNLGNDRPQETRRIEKP